jgi:outer membrane lipoprotein SlyB
MMQMTGLRRMAGLMAVLVAVSTGLGACANAPRTGGSGGSYNDPLNQELASRNARFATTVGEGALIGALGGAALGGLIGGDWESAAIGAGAGAAAGAAAGLFVASNNQSYATREAALNGQIQQTRVLVQEYQQDVAVTRQLVGQKRQRIAALRNQLAAGQITGDQYSAELADVNQSVSLIRENIAANEQNIALIEREINQFRRDGLNTSGLEAELQRYRALRDQQLALLNELLAVQASG